jgi:hypothetical protein
MKQIILRLGIALSLAWVVTLAVVGATLVGSSAGSSSASTARAAGADGPNGRLGVGVPGLLLPTYNYTPTRFGWYVDSKGYRSPAPSMEFYRTLRISQEQSGTIYLPLVMRPGTVDFPNCRLGVGAPERPIRTYNYTPTRLGWYVDWGVYSSPPASMDYYRTIRTQQDKNGSIYLSTHHITPSLDFSPSGLGLVVQAHPGQVWMVGNEPDRPYSQDDVMPDMYAQIYHDVYWFIKGIDPTARVAIGAVVQPTPLRLQYLDMVLQAYRAKYGTQLPVDVWNTHSYIIPENRLGPGADIPPGITATKGMQYTLADHLDVNVYAGQVRALRSWMKDRGYQNVPLISTEYGALYPKWYLDNQFTPTTQIHINDFIANAIKHMNTQKDVSIGYPADDYRLIQQIALYSMDDDGVFPPDPPEPPDPEYFRWGSFLFRSSPPYTRTATGDGFVATAQSIAPSVDWIVLQPRTVPNLLIVSPTKTVSPTIQVMVSNAGNTRTSAGAVVTFTDVTSGLKVVVDKVILPPQSGCGYTQPAAVVWPALGTGLHRMRIEVGSSDAVSEPSKTNNVLTTTVFVGTDGNFLPVISR